MIIKSLVQNSLRELMSKMLIAKPHFVRYVLVTSYLELQEYCVL